MTRRKRRKIRKLIRVALFVMLPFTTALIMNVGDCLESVVRYADGILVNGNDELEENVISQSFDEDFEDIFNEQFTISEGYGYEEEVDNAPENEVPLYQVISENPGEKPYPTEWTEGGEILRTTYGKFSGATFLDLENGGQVNNKTSVSTSTLESESQLLPEFEIEIGTDEPQVLIYHTHTTESFEPYVREFYDATFNYRTTDETKNIVMVGNEIAEELEAVGISVIHDKTIHDYPSYNGSYDRSAETIKAILAEYPSIKVVLDIHRDAILGDNIAYQPIVEIDGKEAAQLMIISGCDDGTMGMPNYLKNFRLASLIQSQTESDYSGLTRPILFDYRHYNQDLTTGSLLIEIGSHGNTLEQVQYTGELFGKSLAKALKGIS